MKECVLYDRECIDCGECMICDLDNTKKCDNCCRCLETEGEYRTIILKTYFEKQDREEN